MIVPAATTVFPEITYRTATADALAAAGAVAARVRGREAPVRRVFLERGDDVTATTPLAEIIRGGRGGTVRLRLLLSILWFAGSAPYDVTYPNRAWATLLDLRDPPGAGARRIADATTWLANANLVEIQQRPGLPSRMTLLDESGSGKPYVIPGLVWRSLPKDATPQQRQAQRYLRLPPEFWTKGWAAVLSAPAIAAYLMLLSQLGSDTADSTDLWISPTLAELRYGLSEDTRSTGLRELVRVGLASVERRRINADTFDLIRNRNIYRLRPKALGALARVPQPTKKPSGVGR